MKITLDSLMPGEPFAVELSGSEAWLEAVYAQYPPPAGTIPPQLQGEVELTLWDDFVRVSGAFSYAPYVSCGRCALSIPWPLDREPIEQSYLVQAPADLPDELDLNTEDLEMAFLENGQLDLEKILIEAIELALPIVTSPSMAEGGSCTICLEDVSDPCVFSSYGSKSATPNPFAKLGQLKL